jgi:hypothetical protein
VERKKMGSDENINGGRSQGINILVSFVFAV